MQKYDYELIKMYLTCHCGYPKKENQIECGHCHLWRYSPFYWITGADVVFFRMFDGRDTR